MRSQGRIEAGEFFLDRRTVLDANVLAQVLKRGAERSHHLDT